MKSWARRRWLKLAGLISFSLMMTYEILLRLSVVSSPFESDMMGSVT